MFLFSHKTKTPISTYSDSYRDPTSIKEGYKDPPLWAWEANRFVTPVSSELGRGLGGEQPRVYSCGRLDH